MEIAKPLFPMPAMFPVRSPPLALRCTTMRSTAVNADTFFGLHFLRRGALEILGCIDAAAACVTSHLRLGAERACAIDFAVGCMRCDHLGGRDAFLHPLLHGREGVE